MPSGQASLAFVLAVAAVATGCSGPRADPAEPPSPPPGWTVVTNDQGDLRLALPPWLVPFETNGAIFANEVVAAGGQGIQLMVEGPATAEPQPGGEGTQRWLEQRIEAPGAGVAAVTSVRLPAGESIVIRRVDRAGTPLARNLVAYAITNAGGTASLVIDGPPDAWAAHEDDIARIAEFVRTRR